MLREDALFAFIALGHRWAIKDLDKLGFLFGRAAEVNATSLGFKSQILVEFRPALCPVQLATHCEDGIPDALCFKPPRCEPPVADIVWITHKHFRRWA